MNLQTVEKVFGFRESDAKKKAAGPPTRPPRPTPDAIRSGIDAAFRTYIDTARTLGAFMVPLLDPEANDQADPGKSTHRITLKRVERSQFGPGDISAQLTAHDVTEDDEYVFFPERRIYLSTGFSPADDQPSWQINGEEYFPPSITKRYVRSWTQNDVTGLTARANQMSDRAADTIAMLQIAASDPALNPTLAPIMQGLPPTT